MKKFERRSVSVLLAVVLMLVLTLGTAWAYFSAYDAFVGGAVLQLDGQTEIEEQTTDTSKTVVINNTGKSDVIVKVMIYGPEEMTLEASDDWKVIDNGDGSFIAYYRSILPAGESTTSMTAKIDGVPVTIENSDVEIIVMQECAIASFDENNKVIAPGDWAGFPEITAA